MPKRLGYLAPPGTYTEEATERYDPRADRIPFPTFKTIIEAVRVGEVDEGVTPIENSLEGAVVDTLDLLIEENTLQIKQEIMVPILHCLLIKPNTLAKDINTIYSHPQALGQCRRFLEHNYPNAQLLPSLSTAAAVEQMQSSDSPAAAIASQRAGDLYGAKVLEADIQDQPGNTTRFVVWAQEDHAPTGHDKTSICFEFDEAQGTRVGETPGLLYEVVSEFAQRGISMAKIESRPAKREMGRYFFLVDLLGHRQDVALGEALENIRKVTSTLKIFGSYPRVTP